MSEYFVRFLVGGVVLSAFSMLGDILRPKSFAGLFRAAPSVALGRSASNVPARRPLRVPANLGNDGRCHRAGHL
jgi:hypothetical protein